jgi:hypothetical protein
VLLWPIVAAGVRRQAFEDVPAGRNISSTVLQACSPRGTNCTKSVNIHSLSENCAPATGPNLRSGKDVSKNAEHVEAQEQSGNLTRTLELQSTTVSLEQTVP